MMHRCILICVMLCCVGTGCSGGRARTVVAQAEQNTAFRGQTFATSNFTIFGMLRPASGNASTILHVYIEGDGFAWQGRTQPSSDPTPNNPTGLRLALADKSPNAVLYLARPCQYVQGDDALLCRPTYWTSARLAPVVIKSLNEALDTAKQRAGATEIVLVGYSGGGAAAVLMAAKRDDVRFLGTVAAPLDLATWTRVHNMSPLHASLNPMDVAAKVATLPQRHMSSRADTVVPPSISQLFCRALRVAQACSVVDGPDHGGAWEKAWNYNY